MRKLARWFKSRGMPILGDAFSVWVTGGRAAIPKVIEQVTKTLGLGEGASESEILRRLTGSVELQKTIAELEASLDSQIVAADLDAYLAQLDYDKERVQQAGLTARAELQSKDTFITHARPTGLYLSYKWVTGFLIFFVAVSGFSSWIQYQLLKACVESANTSDCIAGVRTAKNELPLGLVTNAIAAVGTPIWMAILSPLYAYFPLRSADKWIRSRSKAKHLVDHGDLIKPVVHVSPPRTEPTHRRDRNYDAE